MTFAERVVATKVTKYFVVSLNGDPERMRRLHEKALTVRHLGHHVAIFLVDDTLTVHVPHEMARYLDPL